ncbi:MAG: AAA family ATPase, partial [Myxococcota bacterium]
MPSRSGRKIELGFSHFYELRQRGSLLVDKSRFIQHVLEASYAGMLIPRPRRFGKT